jgi:hypothetical protein
LFEALGKAGAVSEENANNPKKVAYKAYGRYLLCEQLVQIKECMPHSKSSR